MANEDKSARYHRLRRRALLLDGAVQMIFLLILVVSGASSLIRASVESIVGTAVPLVAAVYVLVVAAIYELIHLPFAFYVGNRLERRYGLSMETPARWLRDHLKAAALVLAFLIVAGVVVALLLRSMPVHWWVVASICFGVVVVGLTHLAPVILLPLFDEVRPLEREALRRRLVALAEKAGAPVLGVFEWRVGDRTTRANAALAGIGRTRRILLCDTLLAGHSDDEIETVLAHELAHHVYGDIWSALALEFALVVFGFFVADQVLAGSAALGLEGKADVAALPLVPLAGGAVALAIAPLANALSRAHERRADRYALDTTRNANAFISAMKRLAATNLAEEHPSRWVELLLYSHPSTSERIAAARQWMAGQRAG